MSNALIVDAKENVLAQYGQAKEKLQEIAEKARVEEAARIKAQQEEEAAEKARQEALRPDREKLISVADQIDAIKLPVVSEWLIDLHEKIESILIEAASKIRGLV